MPRHVSAISQVSTDECSPNFCHIWRISKQRWTELIRFWCQKVKGQGHIIAAQAFSIRRCRRVQLSRMSDSSATFTVARWATFTVARGSTLQWPVGPLCGMLRHLTVHLTFFAPGGSVRRIMKSQTYDVTYFFCNGQYSKSFSDIRQTHARHKVMWKHWKRTLFTYLL